MKLLSVNLGLPRVVEWREHAVSTAIFKQPVAGRIRVRTLNLDGDRQADLRVHGGRDKAVYGYAAEHYVSWQAELPDVELSYGMFGENLTTQGLTEDDVFIGNRYRIGSAQLVVTQPRLPCAKLGLRFGRTDIIRKFLASGRTGFYFAVEQEGELGQGDEIELLERDDNRVTVADITRLHTKHQDDIDTMRRAVKVAALADGWRVQFLAQIEKLTSP